MEPNVPMDLLVEETLKYGLVPPVVMEFSGITAGGGYAGTSGESSSFKHGFFHRTINYVEMVRVKWRSSHLLRQREGRSVSWSSWCGWVTGYHNSHRTSVDGG
jgi:FAD/FMN-containing dehydrogenase